MPENQHAPSAPDTTEAYISQPITTTLTGLTRLLSTNLASYLVLFVVSIALFAAVIGLTFGAAFFTFIASSSGELPTVSAAGPLVIAAVLVAFVGSIVLSVAISYLSVQAQSLTATTAGQAVNRGFKRFFTALGAGILSSFAILGGLILLIIPGIYIALRLSFVSAVVAKEDVGAIEALRRSFALTKGKLWELIGIVSVAVIASTIVSILATLALSATPDSATWVVGLVYTLLVVAVGFVTSFGLYLRYHQAVLVERQEIERGYTNSLNYILLPVALTLGVIDGGLSAAVNPAPADDTFIW